VFVVASAPKLVVQRSLICFTYNKKQGSPNRVRAVGVVSGLVADSTYQRRLKDIGSDTTNKSPTVGIREL
jgi:hypothetical protein